MFEVLDCRVHEVGEADVRENHSDNDCVDHSERGCQKNIKSQPHKYTQYENGA